MFPIHIVKRRKQFCVAFTSHTTTSKLKFVTAEVFIFVLDMSSQLYLRAIPKIYATLPIFNVCHKRSLFVSSIAFQINSFKFTDLQINVVEPSKRKPKPDPEKLVFGKHFSDHMFEVEWNLKEGWGIPKICPLHDLQIHPAAKVLHYAQELFEGMKAYRSSDDEILLFRPHLNIQRLLRTAERASLPLFDEEEFLKCLKKLVSIDKDWAPRRPLCSLYIRPTFIGIESSLGVASSDRCLLYIITGPVGPYFKKGTREPVSLLADPGNVRAWPGGIGDKKMGANYASTIYIQKQAEKYGIQQVLWLYGKDHQLTEVGTMNIFVYLINDNGEKELVTPPLDGIILPGVTRHSLVELTRKWNEFKMTERPITMKEVKHALSENRLLEIFGAGTACCVCPVASIRYMDEVINIPTMSSKDAVNQRLFDELIAIQTGKKPSDWTIPVD